MKLKTEKINSRALYTRQLLKESLLELMKKKPIAKISLSELCREADVNRNTFYTHYDSPEMLLACIEHDFYKQVQHSVVEALQTKDTLDLFEKICKTIYKNRELCSILFSEHGNKDYLRYIIELSRDLADKNWKEDGIQDISCGIDMLYHFFVNGALSVMQLWIQNGMQEPPENIAHFLYHAVYYGRQGFLSDQGR